MDSKNKRRGFSVYKFNQLTFQKTTTYRSIFFALFLIFSLSIFAQDGDPVAGKALFNTNCASCHKLDKKMTGPALRYVEKRLSEDEGLDRQWLYSWIRNSSAMIKSGDACLLYTSPSPRDATLSRMPSSA